MRDDPHYQAFKAGLDHGAAHAWIPEEITDENVWPEYVAWRSVTTSLATEQTNVEQDADLDLIPTRPSLFPRRTRNARIGKRPW